MSKAVRERERIVVRFAGDSGDGMQLTGDRFTSATAVLAGIFEIMEVGEELRELIFQQIPKDVLRRVAVDLGMQTLKSSAVDKILDGTTTVEEAYRVVSM